MSKRPPKSEITVPAHSFFVFFFTFSWFLFFFPFFFLFLFCCTPSRTLNIVLFPSQTEFLWSLSGKQESWRTTNIARFAFRSSISTMYVTLLLSSLRLGLDYFNNALTKKSDGARVAYQNSFNQCITRDYSRLIRLIRHITYVIRHDVPEFITLSIWLNTFSVSDSFVESIVMSRNTCARIIASLQQFLKIVKH